MPRHRTETFLVSRAVWELDRSTGTRHASLGALYWTSTDRRDVVTDASAFVLVPDACRAFLYSPYCRDFGPPDAASVVDYIRLVRTLRRAQAPRAVVHKCGRGGKERANAALLMGSYMVVDLHVPVEACCSMFSRLSPPLTPYRDASDGPSFFSLTLRDVLEWVSYVLVGAPRPGVCDEYSSLRLEIDTFDTHMMRCLQDQCYGNISWIIPQRLIAMSDPDIPSLYVEYFVAHNVKAIVRLCEPTYAVDVFEFNGINVFDMPFTDGACPPPTVLFEFISLMCKAEKYNYAVAVHCRAGLGRTGTLIACYLIWKYGLSQATAIAHLRMMRPGSIVSVQQVFIGAIERLIKKEKEGVVHEIEKIVDNSKRDYHKRNKSLDSSAGIGRIEPNTEDSSEKLDYHTSKEQKLPLDITKFLFSSKLKQLIKHQQDE